MEQFREAFVTEANEIITKLEESILALEQHPDATQEIEEVFRAMHNLKGSSAMFGFAPIGELTHDLETLYDSIRQQENKTSTEILNVTLQSIDHIRNLLQDAELKQSTNQSKQQNLLKEIASLLPKNGNKTKKKKIITEAKETATYYINFTPNADILKNGTKLLYLIDDLHNLGESKVILKNHKVPSWEELKAENLYISWDIFLATEQSFEEIKDIFLFVESRSKITIKLLENKDLLQNEKFLHILGDLELNPQKVFNWEEQKTQLLKINSSVKKISNNGKVQNQQENDLIASLRVSADKLDNLLGLVSELVTTQARFNLWTEKVDNAELFDIAENMEKISRRLQEDVFRIRLVPLREITTRLKRLVRDTAHKLKKEVDFTVEGEDTEMDKSLLEALSSPLIHLLRNAVDHGLEANEERLEEGKPSKGKLKLKAFYAGARIFIQVIDDGKGIDAEKVRKKAIEKGWLEAEQNLSRNEILQMIFLPGFSTVATATKLSGRGVGLDVVKRSLAQLRGEVEVESKLHIGTTFTLKLPLTLSILDGLLVEVGETAVVIPLASIQQCYEVPKENLKEGLTQWLDLDEGKEPIPYRYLQDILEYSKENMPDNVQLVKLRHEEKELALTVDKIVGEYQAVVKPLGSLYRHVKLISGASILGDGRIALVLDIYRVMEEFTQQNIELNA